LTKNKIQKSAAAKRQNVIAQLQTIDKCAVTSWVIDQKPFNKNTWSTYFGPNTDGRQTDARQRRLGITGITGMRTGGK